MKTPNNNSRGLPYWTIVPILAVALFDVAVQADEGMAWGPSPVLPRDPILGPAAASGSSSHAGRSHRIRLFRIQPGFLSEPMGLDQVDSTPEDCLSEGPDWLQLAMGTDNPYFDARRPGDPGGVGYFRLFSGVQLFDNQRTGCAVALQAVTPAGLEWDGVPGGPTVLSPTFSLTHSLDDEGTAIHGFVGRQVHFNAKPGPQYRGVEYGLAVQRPLSSGPNAGSCLYLFVETLGRYRFEPDTAVRTDVGTGNRSASAWEVLPGLHWRYNDHMWISGSLILPVNTTPPDPRLWQVTCSFRF
jgi:hypothetical protein